MTEPRRLLALEEKTEEECGCAWGAALPSPSSPAEGTSTRGRRPRAECAGVTGEEWVGDREGISRSCWCRRRRWADSSTEEEGEPAAAAAEDEEPCGEDEVKNSERERASGVWGLSRGSSCFREVGREREIKKERDQERDQEREKDDEERERDDETERERVK